MMRHFAVALLLAVGVAATPPAALSKTPEAALPQPTTVPGKLVEGTAVKLTFNEKIKTGEAKKGDPIHFVVAEDVKDPQGSILIKRLTPAVGVVTRSTKAKALGKPGKLVFEFTSTTAADGQKVLLRGKEEQRGKRRSITAKGGNVTLEPGATYTAYVDCLVSVKLNAPDATATSSTQ